MNQVNYEFVITQPTVTRHSPLRWGLGTRVSFPGPALMKSRHYARVLILLVQVATTSYEYLVVVYYPT